MIFNFNNVIVRSINKSIINAISSKETVPNLNLIIKEHNKYLEILRSLDLNIYLLNPLEKYPDSIFVEDPALVYKSNCIILNPKHTLRNAEKNILYSEIKNIFRHQFLMVFYWLSCFFFEIPGLVSEFPGLVPEFPGLVPKCPGLVPKFPGLVSTNRV